MVLEAYRLDRLSHAFGDPLGISEIGADDHDLLPSPPSDIHPSLGLTVIIRDHVAAVADGPDEVLCELRERFGNGAENLIPHLVTVGVVDHLEVVDVDEEETERVSTHRPHLPVTHRDDVAEVSPVVKAGEGIPIALHG